MKQAIFTTLSPNAAAATRVQALWWLMRPWLWQKGKNIARLENAFAKYFETEYAISFDSGRSALLAILTAMDIGKGDEVIVPGFTCVVVPNAVIFSGARPVYCDCDSRSFNIDPLHLEKLITPRTKAIIMQHTFGRACEMEKIMEIAKRHHLRVIEDCAHSLGSRYCGRLTGMMGDAAIFSFGRDKVISSVHGGMAIAREKHFRDRIRALQHALPYPSYISIFRALFHPIAFGLALPLYRLQIGKVLLYIFQKLGLLSKALESGEKKGIRPRHHPRRLPNANSAMALHQFQRLGAMNTHRVEISRLYHQNIRLAGIHAPAPRMDEALMLYTIVSERAEDIIRNCAREGIELGNWTGSNILPPDSDRESVYYEDGSCPRAESFAKHLVNLPTHINIDRAKALAICDAVLQSSGQ